MYTPILLFFSSDILFLRSNLITRLKAYEHLFSPYEKMCPVHDCSEDLRLEITKHNASLHSKPPHCNIV